MLTLLTSEEFETWFSALADAEAEEVATGLQLVESLGPDRAPSNSSELLLWFQSRSGNSWIDERFDPEFFSFATRVRKVVDHLESTSVQRQLGGLSRERAETAARAVQLIGARARRWRHGLDGQADEAWRVVESHYRKILDAVGIRVRDDDPPGAGLRQLDLRQSKPGMRVLYGIDPPGQRALVLLGEPLDRIAYGPSVRRALSLWREFLASDANACSRPLQSRSAP
jgi:hypothetical protein